MQVLRRGTRNPLPPSEMRHAVASMDPLCRLASALWKQVHACNELVFLGIASDGDFMPAGLLALHRIVWKMLIIAMTQSEMEKTPVSPAQIWRMAVRRFLVRVRALHTAHTRQVRIAERKHFTPPKPSTVNRWMEPIGIASIDEDCKLTWRDEWIELCNKFECDIRPLEYWG